jgi:formate dehydrogenase subunit delta
MSGSSLDRLIHMANQIAREFGNQRPADAASRTCDHLWHFWDPRMRQMALDHLAAGGSGFTPIVVDALRELEATLGKPRSMTKATKFNQAVDAAADRDLMSDAG